MSKDTLFMTRALELARRGAGFVHPNPMVGCVIVRGGKILAEGYHHAYGRDHAEVDALKKAGTKARGATLYVNLEPCAHWGKTPPCMIAVVGAGIRDVVAAMQDPNPQVAGKGFAFLKQHGVRVRRGILEQEALELNKAFLTRIQERRPYVTLKAAMSLDGKTETAGGESQWITGPEARKRGHQFRATVDAIVTGVGTVLEDDPVLTAHGLGRNPKRIIFDSALRIPLQANVLNKAAATWIFTTSRAPVKKRRALERKGISVYIVAKTAQGQVSLPEAARVLAREKMTHLLLEAGGVLNAAFIEAGLVDEVLWFIAPKIIGGAKAKTAVEGQGIGALAKAWNVKDMTMEKVGDDVCVRETPLVFTGIISAVGKIVKYDGNRLGIRCPYRQIKLGESVSINGVCLTVVKKAGQVLFFDVGPATRRITTLGRMKPGARVNLERALRVGDRVGGHWVSGHVELTGQVQKWEAAGESRWLHLLLPKAVMRYVIAKGSLAVDGISLTVAAVQKNSVKIMLIPHTLTHTILGGKKPGDAVNIEPDLLAKYARTSSPAGSSRGSKGVPRLRLRGMTF